MSSSSLCLQQPLHLPLSALLPLLFQQGGGQSQGHRSVLIQGFGLLPGLLPRWEARLGRPFSFGASGLRAEEKSKTDRGLNEV